MPPPHLSEGAKLEWDRVREFFRANPYIARVDAATLAAYCQAYGRWMQAERLLAQS
jgi:P27 family predicted phage terminase small subunit